MSVVVHRTTMEYHVGVGILAAFKAEGAGGPWVHDPTVTAVLDVGDPDNPLVPVRDWKWTADVLSEMTQGEKDARDSAEAAAVTASDQARVKAMLLGDPVDGLIITVGVAGLVLTTNIQSHVVDDEITVVADASDTKYVKVCYIWNEATDTFSIQGLEKTTGEYAALLPEEHLVRAIKEFSVVASGTTLVDTGKKRWELLPAPPVGGGGGTDLSPATATLTGDTWDGKPTWLKHFSGSSLTTAIAILTGVDRVRTFYGSVASGGTSDIVVGYHDGSNALELYVNDDDEVVTVVAGSFAGRAYLYTVEFTLI